MLDLLKMLNYDVPKIEPFSKGSLEVEKWENSSGFVLKVNGEQWMSYNLETHLEAYHLFSHYYLAEGHCICSGLGFGIRENWLLTKKNVSKITVLEKNKEVIEYHQHIKSPFLDNIELIHCDANEYFGKCDTLLLDHYEHHDSKDIINNVYTVHKNIKHETLWFWPFESIIYEIGLRYCNPKLLALPFNNKISPRYRFTQEYLNFHEIYLDLKKKYNLQTLPEISPDVLEMFIFMHKSDKIGEMFRIYQNNKQYG
jgi:hypothetical protein